MRRQILCLSALLGAAAIFAGEKPDPELPPDLTHIRNTSFTVTCEGHIVFSAQTKKTEEIHYCKVSVAVYFDDGREKWTTEKPIGETEDSDEDKAQLKALEIGNTWRAKIRKAIEKDRASRGYGSKKLTPPKFLLMSRFFSHA